MMRWGSLSGSGEWNLERPPAVRGVVAGLVRGPYAAPVALTAPRGWGAPSRAARGARTKLDVLEGVHPLKICVAYRVGSKLIKEWPNDRQAQAEAEPVYEEMD